MQGEQEHDGDNRYTDSVRSQLGNHHYGAGQEGANARSPAPDQEAHCGQQEHHAADESTAATTEPTVRNHHRELLQYEHLRNGKCASRATFLVAGAVD